MLKKYAPYLLLLFALLLLFFILRNQRGSTEKEHIQITTHAAVDEGFTRHPQHIIFTQHARCRMQCRHINEQEVKEILQSGKVILNKIEEDERGKTFPLEGKTASDKFVRIVVAPRKNDVVIVTVIDLDSDWQCDCS